MKSRNPLLHSLSLALVMVLVMSFSAFASSIPRMSTDELNSRLGEDRLVVLDVRSSYHWGASDKKILGSERVAPATAAEWAGNYSKEDSIVLYCA